MSARPWYKRYPSDFIAGTMMLTAEEKGVYSTIVDMLYDRGAPIENSPSDLWRICGCASLKRFRGIFERLVHLGKLVVVSDRITNSRFERDRKGRSESIPNANGIDSEQEKPPPDLLENKGLASALPEARTQIPKPSPSGAKTRLPTGDLTIPNSWVEYAASKGFESDAAAQMFLAFVDHHRRHGNAWADWDATWRTWVRNEVKFNNRSGGSNGTRTSEGRGQRHDPVAAAAARHFGGGNRNGSASRPAGSVSPANRMGDERPGETGGGQPAFDLDLKPGPDGVFRR